MSEEPGTIPEWERVKVQRLKAQDQLGTMGLDRLMSGTVDSLFSSSRSWSRAARALRVWHRMSDPSVRTHVCGVSFRKLRRGTEVTFYVDSSAWMYELNMRRDDLVREWNQLCSSSDPDLVADSAAFKLSSSARKRGHDGSMSNYGRARVEAPAVPLSEEEYEGVCRQVDRITNARLRESVKNAMIAMLEWKKSKPSA